MPRAPKLPRDDPEESERFIEMAQELEADQTGVAFERAFRAIAQPKPVSKAPKAKAKTHAKKRRS